MAGNRSRELSVQALCAARRCETSPPRSFARGFGQRAGAGPATGVPEPVEAGAAARFHSSRSAAIKGDGESAGPQA